jgi:hypothetical protein
MMYFRYKTLQVENICFVGTEVEGPAKYLRSLSGNCGYVKNCIKFFLAVPSMRQCIFTLHWESCTFTGRRTIGLAIYVPKSRDKYLRTVPGTCRSLSSSRFQQCRGSGIFSPVFAVLKI